MAALTPSTFRSRCQAGQLGGVIVVLGDDDREKAELVDLLVARVEESLRAFNVQRFYADEGDGVDGAIASARTLPFLAGPRIVVLLRAERLFGRRGRKTDEEPEPVTEEPPSAATQGLERYLAAPTPGAHLVLVAADINRGTRLGKLLARDADIVECWGLKVEKDPRGYGAIPAALSKAAALVKDQVRAAGATISEDALVPLLEHAGTDIAVLRNDLEKLLLLCAGRRSITKADVQAIVPGATQIDQWALTRAIERGAADVALRELALALEGGASPYLVLGQLGWVVRTGLAQAAPGRVKAAVECVFRADQAIKTSVGEPRIVLERLVVELCGSGDGGFRGGR